MTETAPAVGNGKHDQAVKDQLILYPRARVPVESSHGVCPECTLRWFPEEGDQASV